MQTLIVILIVAIAAGFLIWSFIKKFKQRETCGCGCSSCPVNADTCEESGESCKPD